MDIYIVVIITINKYSNLELILQYNLLKMKHNNLHKSLKKFIHIEILVE